MGDADDDRLASFSVSAIRPHAIYIENNQISHEKKLKRQKNTSGSTDFHRAAEVIRVISFFFHPSRQKNSSRAPSPQRLLLCSPVLYRHPMQRSVKIHRLAASIPSVASAPAFVEVGWEAVEGDERLHPQRHLWRSSSGEEKRVREKRASSTAATTAATAVPSLSPHSRVLYGVCSQTKYWPAP